MLQAQHRSSPSATCATNSASPRARLRFYEDEALIAPERRGTQRLYSERDRARLAWILRGKRVGFSLADIKELLDLYDLGDGRRTQRLKTHRTVPGTGRRARAPARSISTPPSTNSPLHRAREGANRTGKLKPMPSYTAPVRDTKFVLDHVVELAELLEPAGLRRRHAGHGRSDPDRGRPLLRGGAAAAQPHRRRGRLQAPRRRVGDHAARLQGGLGPVRRRRLDDASRAAGIWRAGPAVRSCRPRSPNISAQPTTASKCTMA